MPDITTLVTTDGHLLKRSGTTITGVDPASLSGSPTFRGVRAYRSATAQSIPNDTVTAVQLNAESFDSDALHDNTTNNTRFTIPAGYAGKWMIIGTCQYVSNVTGRRHARIQKNGTTLLGFTQVSTFTGGGSTNAQTATVAALVAGDYVELHAYQDSGGALNLEAGEGSSWLAAYYLGA